MEKNKEELQDALNQYKEKTNLNIQNPENKAQLAATSIPVANTFNSNDYQRQLEKETDTDLITGYEIIKLPSEGMYYTSRISEVTIEYMTSKDEDVLTTPSLIENGTVLDVLLKRKIKTKGISVDELLPGDKDALLLFLRSSSYGSDYKVQVYDPRNGNPFNSEVDLTKLKYKEIEEKPDQNGLFFVELPMRKKIVKFRLLKSNETNQLFKNAEAIKEAYNQEHNEYNTMKLKASIVEINGRTDRTYIDKFIDAMPAKDAYTIRKKILDVSPGIDMRYEFITKDGYKFISTLSMGVDFFFPNL
jgi:hypothetical protein